MSGKENQPDTSGAESTEDSTSTSGGSVKETVTETIVEVEEILRSETGRRKR